MYLDWQQRDVYVIDIETDDLDATVIWVMCWKNAKTGETGECRGHAQVKAFFDSTSGSLYVGHNILKFDGPVCNRIVGSRLSVGNCIDTIVLSTLYSPNGEHSLDAWGEKLGRHKIDFSDWSHLSEEMVTYCHRDVEITCELFKRLIKTLQKIGFSEQSIDIQHRFVCILERQRQNGFYFNGSRALELYQVLRKLENKLEGSVHEVFPPVRTFVADRPMFTKDGRDTAIFAKDRDRYILERDDARGRYRAFEDVPFNLGSPTQRVERLLELGWEPEEFTEKTKKGGGGNPKPFDKGDLSPSLQRFIDENPNDAVMLIAKWMAFNGRANMINTWLDNWNEDTGCIHGKIFTADTLRCRHTSPNTANIPGVRLDDAGHPILAELGYYTYESRDLWCARPNRVLVGTDAASLEFRMLAHFLNRPEFTQVILDGTDVHQYNADTVGITRPQAKTLIYAIMYGAAAPKIARTLKVSVKEGAIIRNMFLEKLGLKELMEEAQHEQENGRVSLIDGSQVVCPSPHSALNYKLQGSGARVMARGAILLDSHIRRDGLDSLKVGDIHDEWQFDIDPKDADTHSIRSTQSLSEAGEALNCLCPLDGTAKKGLTWAETH